MPATTRETTPLECLVCGFKYVKRFADAPKLGCPRCAEVKKEYPNLLGWVRDVVRIAIEDHDYAEHHRKKEGEASDEIPD